MRSVLLFVLAGCRIEAAFQCDVDEQCRNGDVAGTCQLERFCSFPDDECPSGQRFADNAGDGLAGRCIGDSLGDAGVDAPPFDVSMCPPSYDDRAPDVQTSRYRLISSRANVWAQAAACKADLPGATHLVVIDSTEERSALQNMLPLFPSLSAFVGVVQDPAATGPAVGWIHFDGRAVSGLWTKQDPDNQGEPEAQLHANVAELERNTAGIADTLGTQNAGALCECDGVPVHPMAQAFLDGDPSKP